MGKKSKKRSRKATMPFARVELPLKTTPAPTQAQTPVRKTNKVGRNEPCHCGSGKKFKKCHGFIQNPVPSASPKVNFDQLWASAQQEIDKHKVRETQRIKQQGLGRSIISTEFQGYRFVAVGKEMVYGKWKTFPDFLANYIKITLDPDWGNAEIAKPYDERHPIMQWYHKMCLLRKQHQKHKGEVFNTPFTGAISAYNRLAYNLYLIAHNGKDIQTELIRRLKINDGFQGAYFEAQVAAWMIKAGFELEFEDEADKKTTHCEFTATHIATGEKYSVEAKSRQIDPNMKSRVRIKKNLQDALEKNADHKRLVFIDLNRPLHTEEAAKLAFDRAERIISQSENVEISGNLAAPAYVLITNMNDQYVLDSDALATMFSFMGFKRPDFMSKNYASFREAARARERHQPMYDLFKSMGEYRAIPQTFDGGLPSEVFGDNKGARLLIGETYLIPDADGNEVPAILTSATVANDVVYGYYYEPVTQTNFLCTNKLTADEVQDYNNHPDTFFGVLQPVSQKIKCPMDWFDFFVDAYRGTDRDKLIELLKPHKDEKVLKVLPYNDLLEILAERYAAGISKDGQFDS